MNNSADLETITFYDVPLVCGAAPSIGCGSRAKPLLTDLERQTPIEEAWLNRTGTIVAIVWRGPARMEEVIRPVFERHEVQCMERPADKQLGESFRIEGNWFRGTEEDAISAGHDCWYSTVPMSLVPRAGAIRQTTGFIKMVADNDTEEVLGVTMVGHTAGEVIHEAAMAMRFHAKIEDFISLLHVYPTMAEALKIVAISRRKDPSRLSCCAE